MIECPDEDSFGLWLAALRALLAEREPPSAIGPAALLGSFGCELDQVALATRTPTLALTLDPYLGEQRTQRGCVQAFEEPPVALGEELEELLVRESAQAGELELEQRVLRRVQVRARARARARTRLGLC